MGGQLSLRGLRKVLVAVRYDLSDSGQADPQSGGFNPAYRSSSWIIRYLRYYCYTNKHMMQYYVKLAGKSLVYVKINRNDINMLIAVNSRM